MKDAVIPVLPTRDHDKTVAFYTRLGLHEIARAGDYLMLKRDAFEVHFADHGDFFDVSQNPCGLYLRLEAVDALAAKAADLLLGGKGVPRTSLGACMNLRCPTPTRPWSAWAGPAAP